jgi:hypothetical protein
VTDPVRARRATVARWVRLGKRAGWLLLLAATVLLVAALATDLNGALVAGASACLIGGAIFLAPSIVLGYAVNAAERDDRSRGL